MISVNETRRIAKNSHHLYWIPAIVIGAAALAFYNTRGFRVAQEFRMQARRGITFRFFVNPDLSDYLTFQASTAVLTELGEDEQGRPYRKTWPPARYSFSSGRLTVEPIDSQSQSLVFTLEAGGQNVSYAHFVLRGNGRDALGFGPIDIPEVQ